MDKQLSRQIRILIPATCVIINRCKTFEKTIVILILILISLISESCGEVVETTLDNQMVYVFISQNNIKEKEYLLSKEIRTEVIKYTYEYEMDNDLEFTYSPKSNRLNFGADEFEETEGAEFMIDTISKAKFKKFHSASTATDVTEPIFFNEDYGILAIGTVMVPTIVFLPYKSVLKTAKVIFDMTLR